MKALNVLHLPLLKAAAFATVFLGAWAIAAPPQAGDAAPTTRARGAGDPAAMEAQRDAMARLARLDGRWRGTAVYIHPDGRRYEMVQTERVGPMLDGAVRVLEGRGHGPDGSPMFDAFAVISYDARAQQYVMRSYAGGHGGEFPLQATHDGFEWTIPGGPVTTVYRATVRDGHWHQTGERVREGAPPERFFEMKLERIGDSEWPAGGAVGPR